MSDRGDGHRSNGTGNPGIASPDIHKASSFKTKAAKELRTFTLLFFYLWLIFGVFVLNQGIVMREQGVNFAMQGFAAINALVFAKVMMVYEMFDPAKGYRERPLVYVIFCETLLVTILFILVHLLEKIIEGLIKGKTVADSLPSIGGGGLAGLFSASVIVFFALLPFFGLKNLSLAMGPGKLRTILLGGR